MHSQLHRFKITNDGSGGLLLFVEPWGSDYTLQVGDTFELVIEGSSPDSHFHLFYGQTKVVMYAEGDCTGVVVYRNGKQLESGLNRAKDEQ